jgi:peptide/nickel transport system permease protein
MAIYLLIRLTYLVIILGVMSVLVFLVTQAMPGNVAQLIAGQFATQDVVDAISHKLGLDQPLLVQYEHWAAGILRGDLGTSLVLERPIAPLLGEALGHSLVLSLLALTLVTVLGISVGIYSAIRRDSFGDHLISTFCYLGVSVPEFFWAIVLILVFGSYLKLLPTGGYTPIQEGFLSWLSHLVLPAITLTMILIARIARLTRSSMLEVLHSNYVKYARAKGMPERIVIVRYALRNALLPAITALAADFGLLIGGMVVIETVFAYPGIGRLLLFAIERHDIPLIQANILVVSAMYCLANLISDLLYSILNPKIRYGRGAQA